jgi:hypothetical protein
MTDYPIKKPPLMWNHHIRVFTKPRRPELCQAILIQSTRYSVTAILISTVPSRVVFTCGPLALRIFGIKNCIDFSYVLPRACYIVIEGKQLNRTTWRPSGMILLFIRGFTNIDLHTVIEQGTTNTTQAHLQLGGQNFKL